ncbi:hypothetical protein [Apibacter adventoris]|uniref:Uncharacterized protein n=1 Tax=Apibacter adventoris TaxID=1679466 RepID=A0A2S8AFK3_9FLAO|nr:hypothetical protein [Apibacter adventoris]PQL94888.1 hypothetical protein C4S77_02590 [Apibacter adventoris]
MKRSLVALIMLFSISFSGNAQVGVNTNTPMATLHIENLPSSATVAEGILIPRVTVADLDAQDSKYQNDQNGSLVFVTDNSMGTQGKKTSNINGRGFYFYDAKSSKWASATPSSNGYGDSGSFTATPISFDLVKTNPTTLNLNSYVNDYNYFEFNKDSAPVDAKAEIYNITFPSALVFKNKTIYFFSRIPDSKNGGVRFTNVPSEFINSNNLGLSGNASIRLYSDGTRWYLMSGNFYVNH